MTTALAFSVEDTLKRAMPKIAAVCARHLPPERLFRLAVAASQRDPKLIEAIRSAPETFLRAVFFAGRLGLELDAGPLGGAHLVPRWNSRNKRREVGIVIDYRGLVDLATRSGAVVPGGITAHEVCEADVFEHVQGTREKIRHIPELKKPRGEIYAFYAVARMADGSVKHEVMSRSEVDAIRDRFHGDDSFSPWKTDYARMGVKTVVRRLCNLMPKSVEMSAALAVQAADEAGDNALTASLDASLDVPPELAGEAGVTFIRATVESPAAAAASTPPLVTAANASEKIAAAKARARKSPIASQPPRAQEPPAGTPPSPPASSPAPAPGASHLSAYEDLVARLGGQEDLAAVLLDSDPDSVDRHIAEGVRQVCLARGMTEAAFADAAARAGVVSGEIPRVGVCLALARSLPMPQGVKA